jgi:hypothetical protein
VGSIIIHVAPKKEAVTGMIDPLLWLVPKINTPFYISTTMMRQTYRLNLSGLQR